MLPLKFFIILAKIETSSDKIFVFKMSPAVVTCVQKREQSVAFGE